MKSEAPLQGLGPRLQLHLEHHLGRRQVDKLTVRPDDQWLQAETEDGQSRALRRMRGPQRFSGAWLGEIASDLVGDAGLEPTTSTV